MAGVVEVLLLVVREVRSESVGPLRGDEDVVTTPQQESRDVDGGDQVGDFEGVVGVGRKLLPQDVNVGPLCDSLDSELCGEFRIHLQQLNEPGHWKESLVTRADLPHERRTVLEAAIDAGYYQTPRNVTLEELSDRLSMPRSTLRYRLRRAEQFVTTQFGRGESTPTSF